MSAPVVIGAPAKINLYLHVLGRRPDGYHDLDSLVAFATLHDVITVAPADEWSLAIDGPFNEILSASVEDHDNLVLRAARVLAEHLGHSDGAALRLHKEIPIEAGLGGGSSDGAAVLLALCRMWHADVPMVVLSDMARRLGADLSVCLHSRTAFMGGVGEQIEIAPEVPPLGILLVNPRARVPTADVFRHWSQSGAPIERPSYQPADPVSLINALRDCRNDLTAPAIAMAPTIGTVLSTIESTLGVLLTRMSGSGATCFGLFADAVAAQAAAEQIAQVQPEWWVRAGRLIRGREELVEF